MSENRTPDRDLQAEAVRIGEQIADERIELPDGNTGWVGYDDTDGKLVLHAGQGLYSGQLGIGVFFSALASVTGESRYTSLASDAVQHLLAGDAESVVEDLEAGISDGLGSLTYGLTVMTALSGEERYRDRAVELARAYTDEQIENDDSFDVLSGTAGAIHGLLRLFADTGEPSVLNRAVVAGEHLLANRYEKWGYQVWDTRWTDGIQSFSTGMGHGAAGIAYALFRLYDQTDDERFRLAAEDALGFENIFYSAPESNWKANWTDVRHYPHWWCYGHTGVGLARLGSLEYHESDTLRRDLQRAVDGIDAHLADRDSICHGTFSQVEMLIEVSRVRDDVRLDQAKELAVSALKRRKTAGNYRVAYGHVEQLVNPTLFLGTAGIGYTLLRLLRPAKLPSVLRLE